MERSGVILLLCLVLALCSCSQRTIADVTRDDVINPPETRDTISSGDQEGKLTEASETGNVSGTVYLEKKAVTSFVVQLQKDGRFVDSATTDKNGHYSISNLPPGDYDIRILNYAGMPVRGYDGYVLIRVGRTEVLDITIIST